MFHTHKLFQFEQKQKFLLLLCTLVLGVVFSPVRHGSRIFLELGNLADVLRQVSEMGILAVGMTVVILTGGIDLSVGALVALSATLASKALMVWHWNVYITVSTCLSLGLMTGVFYSVLIARFQLPPFVVTLAAMGIARGMARLMADSGSIALVSSAPLDAVDRFLQLAGKWAGTISIPALIYVGVAIAVAVWLKYFLRGRHVYAVGGSPKAARFVGIRMAVVLAFAYGLCGLLAALTGLIHGAQLEQGNPNDGFGYELDAIAAVVIGGTRLTGGAGTVAGTVVGTLVIGILNNILGLNNIDANLQLIIKGVLILMAMGLQQWRLQRRTT